MIELKDLLGRFEKLISKEEIKSEVLAQVLSKYVKVKIEKKDIAITNDNIFLKIKPIYKNELFLHKEEIQKEIKGKRAAVISNQAKREQKKLIDALTEKKRNSRIRNISFRRFISKSCSFISSY